MSHAEDAPQPPKVLTTPLEISAHLRMLQESHDPLIITFHERSQRFQSYLVEVDRDTATLAFDEMIPRDGERFLEAGEPFRVEGFHDGVRIAWECTTQLTIDDKDGHRCYHGALPTEIVYHQRRNAFRAALKLADLVNVKVDGDKIKVGVKKIFAKMNYFRKIWNSKMRYCIYTTHMKKIRAIQILNYQIKELSKLP